MPGLDALYEHFRDKKVALYGLSTETERVLPELGNYFHIIGLLDGFREEGEIYGLPILPLSAVLRQQAALIIVVARPGSCRVIAKRIGEVCRESGIALFDIRGKNLLEESRVCYDFSLLPGYTRGELLQKIAQADVVSFDLFDTLVMRRVLFPTDIYELVDIALRNRGVSIKGFSKLRLESEKELAVSGAPTLEEIYQHMLKKLDDVNIAASELAELEWQTDCKTILPRTAVCEVFCEIVEAGKRVYIVSDTYYTSPQLNRLLERAGVKGYKGILASCEYGTGKVQQLFGQLKESIGASSCLHIGDDITADVEGAARAGIDSFRLYSGSDLLDAVGYLGLSEHMNALTDRLKIGFFVSELFNNPFQFETEQKRIGISDTYDIGFLVCAPIISDFVLWFHRQVKRYGIQNIWFGARDGYLLQKLYQELEPDARTEYFLTSRTAAIRAGIYDKRDILYVDGMKFSGGLEENLKARFGLEAREISDRDIAYEEAGLLKYEKSILESSAVWREGYQAYLDTLEISDDVIAFFDFVAKGTTQLYVQKLVKQPVKGLYFLQLEPGFMHDKGLDIEAFYKKEETQKSSIYDDYYILETILTAPHPSIYGFADGGKPVYAKETRSEGDKRCFLGVQNGILDYFRLYLELVPKDLRHENKKLDEVFLRLIHGLEITAPDFLSMTVEDPFFNRMTEISDLI
ncbi:MAG: hypothetical protein NC081_02840 [Roseburia sp.]|nr:hypothetical protein [Roseburia sp.]